MIRIGNILIDPKSVDTVLREYKHPANDHERCIYNIQIIYKSGVVKNIPSNEIGLSYEDFLDGLMQATKRTEDRKFLRVMAAINSNK